MPSNPRDRSHSAYYSASVDGFLSEHSNQILGTLTSAHTHDLDVEQRRAWEDEIPLLKQALRGFAGTVYLEFDVPRLGSRIDAVVISGPAIFPIEFKCGEHRFRLPDYNQVWDYALDLKNFHLASHHAPIFPMLLATDAKSGDDRWLAPHADGVRPPRRCGAGGLQTALDEGLAAVEGQALDGEAWGRAPYHPTPTIIEAARALYLRHTVDAIARSDAGAKNLGVTSGAVEEIIEQTRANHEKAIVFLTGVPVGGTCICRRT